MKRSVKSFVYRHFNASEYNNSEAVKNKTGKQNRNVGIPIISASRTLKHRVL